MCFHQASASSPVALKTGSVAVALSLDTLFLTLRLVPSLFLALLVLLELTLFCMFGFSCALADVAGSHGLSESALSPWLLPIL